MEKELLTSLRNTAIEAAIKAGQRIMEIYENEDFEVDMKSDDSPLTKADIASHKIISEYLDATNIPILSEEGRFIPYDERKDWNALWIVDPIDGTKEFIKRNGEFTVNIALIENKKPIAGVVFAPAIDELYFSDIHSGAFLSYGKSAHSLSAALKEASVLPCEKTENYTVVASRSHMSVETQEFIESLKVKHGELDLISKGSSLKLCMVARGSAQCYPRFAPTMEWDTAAGQAICNHAGFKVTDWNTKEPMDYNREDLLNNWFLVN